MTRSLVLWVWMSLAGLGPVQASERPDWQVLERNVLAQPGPAAQVLRAWAMRLPVGSEEHDAIQALMGSAQLRLGDEAGLSHTLDTLRQGGKLAQALGDCLQGEHLYVQGDAEQAERWLKRAMAGWPDAELKTAIPRLRCVEWLARVKTERHQFIEAAKLYRRAIGDGKALSLWRQSLLLSGLAQTLLYVGQWEQAQRLNTEAAGLLDQMPDALAQSEVSRVESLLYAMVPTRADEERSLQAMEDAVGQARLADVVAQEVRTLAELAGKYVQRGDAVRGQQLASQALELAQRERAPYLIDLAQGYLGLSLVVMNRQDEGLRLMQGVLDRLQNAGRLTPMLELLKQQAWALERVKASELALRAHRQARALTTEMTLNEQQSQLLALQAELDAAQIEHDRRELEAQRQLNAQALQGRQLQVRVWSAGLIILLLLLPLMWRWYARSRAAQRALAVITSQLQHQSLTDALTGLPNRRHWHQHVANQPQASGGLCLIDLDFFKHINDRHGHAVGDEVLVAVAQRLQALLPPPHTVVRWGGEEFLIHIVDTDAERMRVWVNRLLEILSRKPVSTQAGPLHITGSLGWGVFPVAPHGVTVPWDTALAWVDALMYHAKQQGRHRAWGLWSSQSTDVEAIAAGVNDPGQTPMAEGLRLVEQRGPGAVQ